MYDDDNIDDNTYVQGSLDSLPPNHFRVKNSIKSGTGCPRNIMHSIFLIFCVIFSEIRDKIIHVFTQLNSFELNRFPELQKMIKI